MTNLKDIKFGENAYCGPAVISALTGKTTDECAAAISTVTGRNTITGVHIHELIQTLKRLRFETILVKISLNSTIYSTLLDLHNKDGLYVLELKTHFVTIEVQAGKIYLIDNHTKSAINAGASARLSQIVVHVYQVVPKAVPVLIKTLYIIKKDGKRVEFIVRDVYEDSSDDYQKNIGFLTGRTESETMEMIDKIKKMTFYWEKL